MLKALAAFLFAATCYCVWSVIYFIGQRDGLFIGLASVNTLVIGAGTITALYLDYLESHDD